MIARQKLSEIRSPEDMPGSPCVTGNLHCPLYTALRTTHGIAGSLTLVLGAAECLWYIGDLGRDAESGASRVFSVAMGWNEMTFGAEQAVRSAFAELMEEQKPEAVFLVTTCIPEITNEDVDSLSEQLGAEYGIPVLPVHTAHYQQEVGEGTAQVLSACLPLMEAAAPRGTVNVLGDSRSSFSRTELCSVLEGAGVSFGVYLPHSSVAEIRSAPAAAVNLITNADGLALAEEMRRRFGTPYVFFAPTPYPEKVLEEYRALFEQLGMPLPETVKELCRRTISRQEELRGSLSGKKFILGPTGFSTPELAGYLADLGLEPAMLVLSRMPAGEEAASAAELMRRFDPLVVRQLERAELREAQQELAADLVIGMRDRHGRGSFAPGFEGVMDFFGQLSGDSRGGRGRGGRPEGGHGGRGGSSRRDRDEYRRDGEHGGRHRRGKEGRS